MSVTLEALCQDAMGLSPDQRMALAYRLLVSVEPPPEQGAEAAWEVEIARRMASHDAGEATSIPADKVFAHLREIALD